MPALSFSLFRDKIESGAKRQTIRSVRKRAIASGDKLFLYWKQQSPKDCERLGEATCISISEVRINNGVEIKKHGDEFARFLISDSELNSFAIADGFDNWQQLIEYVESAYGLPFTGVLIEWDSIKSPF